MPLYDDEPGWEPAPTLRHEYLLGMIRYYGVAALFVAVFVGSLVFLLTRQPGAPSEELTAAELQELVAAQHTAVPKEQSAIPTSRRTGEGTSITIYSTPPGATVLVDYDSVGRTPLVDHSLAHGVYVISLRQESFVPLDTVVFADGSGPSVLDFSLAFADRYSAQSHDPAPGPSRNSPPAAQPSRLEAREEDPPRTRRSAAGRPREALEAAAEPEKMNREVQPSGGRTDAVVAGTLLVTSDPPGAVVRLDGEPAGTTPLHRPGTALGRYRLTLELEGYRPATMTVDVDSGKVAFHHGELEPAEANLTILVQPWGSIYIDGQLHRREIDVQYTTPLPVGRHKVTAVHPVLGTRSKFVDVRAGESQTIVFNLDDASDS